MEPAVVGHIPGLQSQEHLTEGKEGTGDDGGQFSVFRADQFHSDDHRDDEDPRVGKARSRPEQSSQTLGRRPPEEGIQPPPGGGGHSESTGNLDEDSQKEDLLPPDTVPEYPEDHGAGHLADVVGRLDEGLDPSAVTCDVPLKYTSRLLEGGGYPLNGGQSDVGPIEHPLVTCLPVQGTLAVAVVALKVILTTFQKDKTDINSGTPILRCEDLFLSSETFGGIQGRSVVVRLGRLPG